MAALDHVAFGLAGQAHPEVIRADHQIALACELRDHQCRFRRVFRKGRHLFLFVDGSVLIGDKREGCPAGVGYGQQSRCNRRLVVPFRNDRAVGHTIEPRAILCRRIGHRDFKELGGLDGEDPVEPVGFPMSDELVAHARGH